MATSKASASLTTTSTDGLILPVSEPAVGGGEQHGRVDLLGADDRGKLDRMGHLGPDPLRSHRSGVDQPPLGTRPQG